VLSVVGEYPLIYRRVFGLEIMKHRIIILSIIGTAFIVLLSLFSPTKSGVFVLLMVYLLIYVFLVTIAQLVIKNSDKDISNNRALFLSIVCGAAPVILLAVKTFSALNMLDLLLIFGLPVFVSWYGLRSGIFH
jgi:hypothetical protein